MRAQREKLAALGWTGIFDAVVITGALDAGKPDERAFDAVLDALDATSAETVYVGDHPDVDIAGARAAGLRTIHVTDGPDSAAGADGTVSRDALSTRLPSLIASLD